MNYPELSKVFWDNVGELRLKRGLTWDAIGKTIGTTPQSLVTMKKNLKTPSIGYAAALADALGVSIGDLCTRVEDSIDDGSDPGITDVLNVLVGRLSEDDVLILTLMAEQMVSVRKNSKSSDAVDNVAEDEASYPSDGSSALIEKLKNRYL